MKQERVKPREDEFESSTPQDLPAPHMLTTKYVRRPVGGHRTWALALKKANPLNKGSNRPCTNCSTLPANVPRACSRWLIIIHITRRAG